MARSRSASGASGQSRAWGRLLAILAVGVLPWTVVITGESVTFVFSFGLVDIAGPTLTDVVSYTFVHTRGLPSFLFAWPLGVGCYLLALASALSGTVLGREDRRLTAGLLVLTALTQGTVAWGLSSRPPTLAVPVCAVLALVVVWWFEWPAIRGRILPASR